VPGHERGKELRGDARRQQARKVGLALMSFGARLVKDIRVTAVIENLRGQIIVRVDDDGRTLQVHGAAPQQRGSAAHGSPRSDSDVRTNPAGVFET
jgi:hypothetical protein